MGLDWTAIIMVGIVVIAMGVIWAAGSMVGRKRR